MATECPKCYGLSAHLCKTRTDLALKCTCGYYKVLYTTLEAMQIEHRDAGPDVKLPKRNTFLWDTLLVVQVSEPASTGQITERLVLMGRGFTSSDVSSYLSILRVKGLVQQLEVKRGIPGGSVWEITDAAEELLNGKRF